MNLRCSQQKKRLPQTQRLQPFARMSMSVLIAMVSFLCIHDHAFANKQESPFAIRAFHITFRPQFQTPAFYQGVIDQASKLGYNALILHTGGMGAASFTMPKPGVVRFHKWTNQQVSDLLDYAQKAGLEPICDVKIIGKHKAFLTPLAKKYPGLLKPGKYGVMNPAYRFPNGKDSYDVIELPMLDHFIALHGKNKPKYLLLGTDEISVEQLEICAKEMNTTVPKMFAQLINRCSQHLLDQGITPIIWGDMLLGKQLGKPGHGINGFKHDPRIKGGHATFFSKQKNTSGTLTAMNDLTNRNKIIVADWHYNAPTSGEYPSVDYFQAMKFKDVWGTTWYNDDGIRLFARYAAKRKCGGMIATAWHTSISPAVSHQFEPILHNSAVYFRNPAFNPPKAAISYRLAPTQKENTVAAATAQQTGVFLKATQTLPYQVQLPKDYTPAPGATLQLRPHKENQKGAVLTFDQKSHRLTGSITLGPRKGKLPHPYDTILRWVDQDSGYMSQAYRASHFNITNHTPAQAGTANPAAWFSADFSELSGEAFTNGLIYSTGQLPLLLQIEQSKVKIEPTSGALNTRITSAWSSQPKKLWKNIVNQGMQLDVTFKVTDPLAKGEFCALVSLGNYQEGFRLLMVQDRTLLLQFAKQKKGPQWITLAHKVPMDQWTSARVTLTPAKGDQPPVATLAFNDHKRIQVKLQRALSEKNQASLGLGIEFLPHGSTLSGWANFPGLIQKVTIKPYQLSH